MWIWAAAKTGLCLWLSCIASLQWSALASRSASSSESASFNKATHTHSVWTVIHCPYPAQQLQVNSITHRWHQLFHLEPTLNWQQKRNNALLSFSVNYFSMFSEYLVIYLKDLSNQNWCWWLPFSTIRQSAKLLTQINTLVPCVFTDWNRCFSMLVFCLSHQVWTNCVKENSFWFEPVKTHKAKAQKTTKRDHIQTVKFAWKINR